MQINILREQNKEFQIEQTPSSEGSMILVNGKHFEGDISKIAEHKFHILHNNKSYNVEIIKADYKEKSFEVLINGKQVSLEAKDRMDLLLASMGLENANVAKADDLKAPMPGLVLDMMVEVGQEVEKGTPLMILEAMKMENVLKATAQGTIQAIQVEKGQNVEKGATLIAFE